MTVLRLFASVVLCVGFASAPARAVNWEGHDDWFLDTALIEAFTSSLPPPLAKPMPMCSERDAGVLANAYEQVPIPGLNCHKDHPERPAPIPGIR